MENHLTVPFTADFESGGHETERWDEGVDTLAQIKRLVTDIDSPYLGVCVAPPHLWVVNETVGDVVRFLAERKKLFHYYVWDVDPAYERGKDGLDFGPGELQIHAPTACSSGRCCCVTSPPWATRGSRASNATARPAGPSTR